MVDFGRLQKELKDCEKDADSSGITIKPEDDSPTHLVGTIPGPRDTPYEGGTFSIDIVLPDEYPIKQPKMRFLTKVWHPNVCSLSGAICVDILGNQWSPAITLKTALISLQVLLSSPEPNDPLDLEVGLQCIEDHETFLETAHEWTKLYANSSSQIIDEEVRNLTELGIPEELVRSTSETAAGDENQALDEIGGCDDENEEVSEG